MLLFYNTLKNNDSFPFSLLKHTSHFYSAVSVNSSNSIGSTGTGSRSGPVRKNYSLARNGLGASHLFTGSTGFGSAERPIEIGNHFPKEPNTEGGHLPFTGSTRQASDTVDQNPSSPLPPKSFFHKYLLRLYT